MSKKAESKL